MQRAVLLALLTGCTGDDLSNLASELDVYVGVDIGAPAELAQQPAKFHLSFNEPDHGCVFLDDSAQVLLDGVRAERFVREGISHAGCDGDEYELTAIPEPRDVSVITLVDDSARIEMHVPQLLVNPVFQTPAPVQRGAMGVVRTLDTRPIRSASLLWKADAPSTAEWRTYAPDVATSGEIRFAVPPGTPPGPGKLAIEVTLYQGRLDNPSLCPELASCQINARGGATLPLTIE